MNINTFSVFLIVAEEMNFTKAAQRLFITQQTLSGHIKRLEEEYGVNLFERRPTLRLTSEGEKMVFYARQILQAQSSMCNEFADLSSKHSATLDIGMPFMRSGLIGKASWNRFHRVYPNIKVRIVERNTSTLLEQMQLGNISLMVGVDIRPVPGLHVIPVLKEHLCLVVKRDLYHQYYPLESEKDTEDHLNTREISIHEIGEIPMLLPARGTRLRGSLERMYRIAGYMPKILLESERQSTLYDLAKDGEGGAFLSPMVFFDGEGEFVLPEDCYIFRVSETQLSMVGIAYPEDAQLKHYEEVMVEILKEELLRYADAIVKVGLLG